MAKLYIVSVNTGLKNAEDQPVKLEALVRAKSAAAARGALISRMVTSQRATADDVYRIARNGGDIMDAATGAAQPAETETIQSSEPEPSNE